MQYEILAEYTEPGREARYLKAPQWATEGPTAPILKEVAHDGLLYQHQSIGLEKLANRSNLVMSTGTASGKSLVFQVATLDILAKNPQATALAIYPLKALSRDQVTRWKTIAPMAGIPAEAVQKIDGDVKHTERHDLLQKARIAAVTPDIVHAWMLNYSNDIQTRVPSVNQTIQACRNFMANLAVIIIDEAHTYETTFGANMAYLVRRLRTKRQELNPSNPEPLIIAASATIQDPVNHLQQLTGLNFDGVGEDDNGSPRAPLTVQHILGSTTGTTSEHHMVDLINQIIGEHPDGSYIAFADDRQKVERIAAGVEPTGLIHEEDIINDSKLAMSYRSGLQARELIEQRLKDGSMRGVVSTSALEMGIDIPELTVGINLGLPNTVKRTKQRAGRVGRKEPGRFIIVDQAYAFQFDEGGLAAYWQRPPEPANLHLSNQRIQFNQAACLMNEQNAANPGTNINWPDGFQDALDIASQMGPYVPETRELRNAKSPHHQDMRSIDDTQIAVFTQDGQKRLSKLTEMTKTEAMKEVYTWATYHHAKQAYAVHDWHENGTQEVNIPHVVIKMTGNRDRRTVRIMETNAQIKLDNVPTRNAPTGFLGHAHSRAATGIEKITGANNLTGNADKPTWEPHLYQDHRKPDITRETPTDMTFLTIDEQWFNAEEIRERIASALKNIMCHMDNIAPEEVMTAHNEITIELHGEISQPPAIALWDRAAGGLGLSKTLYQNFNRYTKRLTEIAEDPTRADDFEIPIPLTTARLLHAWAQNLPEAETTNRTPLTPKLTVYQDTSFRSKLEAKWAYQLDQLGITWQYEPTAFGNWVPDFRLNLAERTVYAEVKPVDNLPVDVTEKIDRSDWPGEALILGNSPDAIWSRRGQQWAQTSLEQLR